MEQDRVTLLLWTEAGERYALPVTAIESVVPMAAITAVPNATRGMLGVINIAGEVVPVVSFATFFRDIPAPAISSSQFMLLTRSAKRRLALFAGEVPGVVEVAREGLVPAETIAPSLTQVTAVVKESDGLVVVPDLESIFAATPPPPFHSGLPAVA
jgi:chemotaxis signal transduction protein